MTETKFTPGPWRIATTGNFGNVVEADCGERIYEHDLGFRTVAIFQPCCRSNKAADKDANAKANGLLISAAPDMFEALTRLSAIMSFDEFWPACGCFEGTLELNEAMAAASAALSRARGEQMVGDAGIEPATSVV